MILGQFLIPNLNIEKSEAMHAYIFVDACLETNESSQALMVLSELSMGFEYDGWNKQFHSRVCDWIIVTCLHDNALFT